MRLITWNINGIRSIWKKGFWDWFQKTNTDLLCLQEIKCQTGEFPNTLFEQGNHNLFINSGLQKGRAGVAIYSRRTPVSINKVLGHDKFDSEGRFLELKFPDFTLINLYMPHGGRNKKNLQYKLDVYNCLNDYLNKFRSQNLILAGDFNIAHKEIDLARPKQNFNNIMFTKEERHEIDKILDLDYSDAFRKFHTEPGNYTWLSYRKSFREKGLGWRIDYIFTSKLQSKRLTDAFILKDVPGSDHCPLGIEMT